MGLRGRKAKITERDIRAIEFIRDYKNSVGYSPTLAEIGVHLGICKNMVFTTTRRLENFGYLKITPRVARSFVILKEA